VDHRQAHAGRIIGLDDGEAGRRHFALVAPAREQRAPAWSCPTPSVPSRASTSPARSRAARRGQRPALRPDRARER
jgi:hypothetical protein